MSLDDAREKMEDWLKDYNEVRPHSAIGNKVPISLLNSSSPPPADLSLKPGNAPRKRPIGGAANTVAPPQMLYLLSWTGTQPSAKDIDYQLAQSVSPHVGAILFYKLGYFMPNSELRIFKDATISLLGFLTVLAITNSIRIFIETLEKRSGIDEYYILLIDLLIVLFTSIRFYYGNIAHLKSDQDDDCFEIVLDCITVLIQALIVGVSAFYVVNPSKLLSILIVLHAIDIFWLALRRTVNWWRKKKDDAGSKVYISVIISAAYVAMYFICTKFFFIDLSTAIGWKTLLVILVVSNFIDLLVNGPRYVGREWSIAISLNSKGGSNGK